MSVQVSVNRHRRLLLGRLPLGRRLVLIQRLLTISLLRPEVLVVLVLRRCPGLLLPLVLIGRLCGGGGLLLVSVAAAGRRARLGLASVSLLRLGVGPRWVRRSCPLLTGRGAGPGTYGGGGVHRARPVPPVRVPAVIQRSFSEHRLGTAINLGMYMPVNTILSKRQNGLIVVRCAVLCFFHGIATFHKHRCRFISSI